MEKKAKLVRRNVKPAFEHDCPKCRFLGSLDGQDLWYCEASGDYIRRFGSEPSENGSLGCLTPPGSPYSLAHQIVVRRLPPAAYVTR
jgi:hypothetical protein